MRTKAGFCLLVLAFLLLMPSCTNKDEFIIRTHDKGWALLQKEQVIGAHRGLIGYPENTYESISAAIDAGFKVVEIDLCITKDSIFVIHHDAKINHCSDGTGYVKDYTLEQLQSYNFGDYIGWSGIKIQTLDFILELCKKNDVCIELDMSNDNIIDDKYVSDIYAIVKKNDMLQNVLFCGNKNKMDILTKIDRNVNIEPALWEKKELDDVVYLRNKANIMYVSIPYSQIDTAFCDKAHNNGIKVETWTAKNNDEIRNAFSIGADYVLSEVLTPKID